MIMYLPLPVRFRLPFYVLMMLLVFFDFHSKNFPGGNDVPLASKARIQMSSEI